MKKIKKLLVLSSFLILISGLSSCDSSSKYLEFFVKDDNEVTVMGCDESVTDVVIPSTYQGNPVTGINLQYCPNLVSVTIPDSVKSIYTFVNCPKLTTIKVSESNQYFSSDEQGVLYNKDKTTLLSCPGALTSISIASSVTEIGRWAFATGAITSITLPNSITTIRAQAFEDCSSLTSLSISDNISVIGDSAFSNCPNLQYNEFDNGYYLGNEDNPYVVFMSPIDESDDISSFTINENTKVMYGRLYSLNYLRQISIPSGIVSICSYDRVFPTWGGLKYNKFDNGYYLGNDDNPYVVLIKSIDEDITSCSINTATRIIYDKAFQYNKKIQSISIPDSVVSIGSEVFLGCENLRSVRFGDGLLNMGSQVFCYSSIIAIEIPDGVTEIKEYTFANCESLISVTLPHSIKSIGAGAFLSSVSTTLEINYHGTQEEWSNISINGSIFCDYTINYI